MSVSVEDIEFRPMKGKKALEAIENSNNNNNNNNKAKEEEEEEEEEEDRLANVLVHSQIEEIAEELGRDARDVETVLEVMKKNWIRTLAEWKLCRDHVVTGALPSLFRVKLDERVKTLEKNPDIGPTLDQIHPSTKEDETQKRVVEELAAAFEAGEKHKVVTKIFLNSMDNFSSSDGTIEFDIGVQCWYIDEKHVGASEGEPNKDVFKPVFEFMKAVDVREVIAPGEGGSFYIRNEYRRWGIVNWYQRFRGKASLDLELHRFPFDDQTIRIRFGMTMYGAEDILLLNRTDPAVVSSFDHTVDALHEWSLLKSSQLKEVLVWNEEDQRDISYLEFSVTVRRRGAFYLWNVFGLIYLLSLLMWVLLLIDPEVLNDRLQICITCFLALVAFNFIVAETLPKISHATLISKYFLLSYSMIAMLALESGVVFLVGRYATGGAVVNGTTTPPGVYFFADAFNTAKIIDWTVMGISAFIQTICLVFYGLLCYGYFRPRPEITPSTLSSNKKNAGDP